jgi:hypothetical protein
MRAEVSRESRVAETKTISINKSNDQSLAA